MSAAYRPERFIGAAIDVGFDRKQTLEKKPSAPDYFKWGDEILRVKQMLQTWFDYGRSGRMDKNMEPAHQRQAERHGSWGVGRYYFRVEVEDGRIFDLYYDRAPKDASHRKGSWHLWREMRQDE
jgi:hypothetical protein